MKKIIGLSTLALLSYFSLQAQSTTNTSTQETSEIAKPSRDFVLLQLGYNGWNQASGTDIDLKGFSRSFAGYLCYDFLLGKKETSNFSFAIGVGVSSSNFQLKNTKAELNISSPEILFNAFDSTYKRSKLNVTYLEAPLEIRYFSNKINRNKGFKFAAGVRVGYLVNTNSKIKHLVGNNWVTTKESSKRYTQTWKFAPTVRVGWGNFSVFGSYNLTSVFKDANGPELYPYQIGIAITGL